MTSELDKNDYAITREELKGTTAEPTYAGVTSFMRRKYTRDLNGVDVAVMGIPFDTATTNRPGARLGPRAIRNASTIMAWEKPYGMAFDPFDKLAVADIGDCLFDHGSAGGKIFRVTATKLQRRRRIARMGQDPLSIAVNQRAACQHLAVE